MSAEYLIEWQGLGGLEHEKVTEALLDERLLQRAKAPSLALYVRVPLEIKTSVRIVRRVRKSTPAVQPDTAVPPALSAGLPGRSTEEQLYKGDVPECLAEGCDKAGEMGDMCAAHYVGGISDKAKAGLRAKKNARQAPLPEKQNGAKP